VCNKTQIGFPFPVFSLANFIPLKIASKSFPFSISITSQSKASNFALKFPNGSTETDVNGYYYVDQIISTWSGTITSSKSGYNFTPSSKTFNGLTGNTTQNFTAISNVSYSWHMGDYGVCNDTCGGGQKTRAVECRRNDGQIMPDSYCSGTKPNEVSYDCPELGPSRLNNVLNGEAYTPNN
jgi:hypothetical protein